MSLQSKPQTFETFPTKFSFLKDVTVKNPYIIIIGLSDYSEYDNSGDSNLPSAKNDVQLLTKLFKGVYNYNHVISIHNYCKIKNETCKITNEILNEFLTIHRSKIHLNEDNVSIDGLMVFYSGHGYDKGLVLTDGSKMMFKDIEMIFNNKSLACLKGLPKIFYLDS